MKIGKWLRGGKYHKKKQKLDLSLERSLENARVK